MADEGEAYQDRWWRSADGDLRLHARDYAAVGEERGLPVVCLHGLTRNARDFEALAPWIAARGRRVVAMDVRGRGESDRDPQSMNYHPGRYAEDVLAGMESLGFDRAVFVGTSMGGLITMVLAHVRDHAVAAAALNDVGPQLNPEALVRIAAFVGVQPDVASWDDAVAYTRGINGLNFPGEHDDRFWEVFARRLFRVDASGRPVLDYDPEISAIFRVAPTGPAPDLWPAFRNLAQKRPTLLIRGALSDLLLQDAAERMRAEAPEMAYAEVPGVGHAPLLDEPESLAALAELLDRAE